MGNQQAPTPPFRNTAPKMEDQQAPTTDDHKYGAEDGYQQALSLDQKFGGEDGGPTGADPRRSDAWRRRCGISRV